MSRVLITAFGPYGNWSSNASWLALVELTRQRPASPAITTRLYPVDFALVSQRLAEDLPGHDIALHLGQAPGSATVLLESIAINVRATEVRDVGQPQPLAADGPVAYQSQLPLGRWAGLLRDAGFPARVSYHAGTFLCNATLYWTHYLCQRHAWPTRAAFVHLPLTAAQALACADGELLPSLPSTAAADALRLILEQLAD